MKKIIVVITEIESGSVLRVQTVDPGSSASEWLRWRRTLVQLEHYAAGMDG